jgi:lactobin A/cerein 7B family class IIb bacteriocin
MNLENLNLVELNAQEKRETDGGIIPIIIGWKAACWIVAGCIFAAGVYHGYREAQSH